jgi:hypothetical protein
MLDARGSNITKLPILMLVSCQEKEKEIGRRERRKGKEYLVYWQGLRMEFNTKINILSIIEVVTTVP